MHERESGPRPDLRLLELLRELSGGARLPDRPHQAARELDLRHSCELSTGRRADVEKLRRRLDDLTPATG